MSEALLALVLSTLAIAATSASNISATPNGARLNVSDYWTEDHAYKNQPHWNRLPDGKIVPSNSSFPDYRSAVETQTPWISKWVLSTEGRRTLKKDIPQLLMYNLVSPMDYGNSLRSNNVRRRRNKAVGMFLTDSLGLPLLKSLGRVAWNLIQSHYVGYFEDEILAQRLEMMNASELIREFNLTLLSNAINAAENEEALPNSTRSYTFDGESKRVSLYAHYSAAFTPYEGYSDQYYTRDDDLPPPTLPADSYPWLWSPHLSVTRAILSHLLQFIGQENDEVDVINGGLIGASGGSGNAELDACSSGCVSSKSDESLRKLASEVDGPSYLSGNMSMAKNDSAAARLINGSSRTGSTAMSAKDIQALQEIQVQLQEFYFDTGIPRFATRSNVSRSVFPSLAESTRASSTSSTGVSLSESSVMGSFSNSSGAEMSSSLKNVGDGDSAANLVNSPSKSSAYDALVHFYAYPELDKWMVVSGKNYGTENATAADCTVKRPCVVQSGVTVYTPALTTLALFQTFATPSADPVTKRIERLKALLGMVLVAFEAERRALSHGLQGPSTAWYSNHDLDVDEFADAVLGSVSMSISGDTDLTPLRVFEKHMNGRVSVLDEVVSYYADTNHDTKVSMQLNRSIPTLDKFAESEVVQLVSNLESQMGSLNRSIVSYVETRASNPQYQEVVGATMRGDFYNGSEYTLVGFGFVMPATNDKNVLYRDMKLPVPFHLALRLIVRFQESRLLLPEESRQILVCLAMSHYNISIDRCRPATPTSSPAPDNE